MLNASPWLNGSAEGPCVAAALPRAATRAATRALSTADRKCRPRRGLTLTPLDDTPPRAPAGAARAPGALTGGLGGGCLDYDGVVFGHVFVCLVGGTAVARRGVASGPWVSRPDAGLNPRGLSAGSQAI